MFDSKNELRKVIKQKYSQITDEYIKKNSKLINIKLIEIFNRINNNKIAASYIALNNEPNVFEFNNYILANKFHLFVPKIISNKKIKLFSVDNNTIFKKNEFNIDEPVNSGELKKNILDINKKITIICPGLAFDEIGNRLGRGAGYYDYFFNEFDKNYFYKIGVAFDFSVFANIPATANDIKMDCLVTSNKIYYF